MRKLGLGCALLVLACAGGNDAVVDDVEQAATQYLDPEPFPPGWMGKNNCTFAFGALGCDMTAHEDSGCWEHAVGDGVYRQQFHRIHCEFIGGCGGPGDAYAVRLCREGPAGQETECGPTGPGPNGCAVCVRNPFCYPQE